MPQETFPIPAHQAEAGAPYPCPQVNGTVVRKAEPSITFTAMAMVTECVTKLKSSLTRIPS